MNGLDHIIESSAGSGRRSKKSNDMALYADFMEDMSEFMNITENIGMKVDELQLHDFGFLKAYEDFSFTSTSQV